jgi:hypothetical protein
VLISVANYSEMLVNNEETTLAKLNWLCGIKQISFMDLKSQREGC